MAPSSAAFLEHHFASDSLNVSNEFCVLLNKEFANISKLELILLRGGHNQDRSMLHPPCNREKCGIMETEAMPATHLSIPTSRIFA